MLIFTNRFTGYSRVVGKDAHFGGRMPAPTRGFFQVITAENIPCPSEENLLCMIALGRRSSVARSGARSCAAVNCRRGRRKLRAW